MTLLYGQVAVRHRAAKPAPSFLKTGKWRSNIALPRSPGHAARKNAGNRKETWLVRVLNLRIASVNLMLCTPCVLLECAHCFEWSWVFVNGQNIEKILESLCKKLRNGVTFIWHPHLRKIFRALDVPKLVTPSCECGESHPDSSYGKSVLVSPHWLVTANLISKVFRIRDHETRTKKPLVLCTVSRRKAKLPPCVTSTGTSTSVPSVSKTPAHHPRQPSTPPIVATTNCTKETSRQCTLVLSIPSTPSQPPQPS